MNTGVYALTVVAAVLDETLLRPTDKVMVL